MQQSRFPRFISTHFLCTFTISYSSYLSAFVFAISSTDPFPYSTTASNLSPNHLFFPLSLRADLDTLLSLREKLSLLWGSLEERKSKSSAKNYSSKPEDTTSPAFECCLKEYGIRSQRRKDLLKEDDGSEPVKEEDEWAKGGAGEVQDKEWGWERRWRMWGTTIS